MDENMDFEVVSILGTLSNAISTIRTGMDGVNGVLANLHMLLHHMEDDYGFDENDGGVHFHPDFPD